mgnify:FL=1
MGSAELLREGWRVEMSGFEALLDGRGKHAGGLAAFRHWEV